MRVHIYFILSIQRNKMRQQVKKAEKGNEIEMQTISYYFIFIICIKEYKSRLTVGVFNGEEKQDVSEQHK